MVASRVFIGVARTISFKAALPFSRKTTIAGRRALQSLPRSELRLVPEAAPTDSEFQLSLHSYDALLEAQVKSRKQGCGKQALEILRAWETNDSSSLPSNIHDKHTTQGPNLRSFTLVVQALLRDPSIPRGEMVAQTQGIYEKAKSMHSMTQFDSSESLLSKEQWGELQLLLLDAYVTGTLNDVSCATRADALLTEMLEETGTASTNACNKVLQAWRTAGRHSSECQEAIPNARALLKRMEELNLTDCTSYSTFVGVLRADARNKKSAQEAIDLLDKLDGLYADTGKVTYKADKVFLSSVISAWVLLGQPQRAQQLLDRKEEEYRREFHENLSGSAMKAPNTVDYSIVMNGWAKWGGKDAAKNTEAVFDRMLQMYKQGNAQAQPNLVSYNTLIGVFAKSCNAKFAQKAEDIFFRLYNNYQHGDHSFKPDTQIMNMVISAWVRCEQPQRAQQLLHLMEKEYRRENLTTSSGTAVIAPDAYTYNLVMNGWSKSGRKDAAKNTEAVFNRMLQMHQQGNAQARPDVVSYRTLIGACAKAGNTEFAQKAEDVFFRLYNAYQQGDYSLKPDPRTMSTVISAWVRCEQPQRAQQLLDRIEEEYQRESLVLPSGSAVMAPVAITYNIVMNGWAKSGRKDAARHTEAVFDRMLQMHKQGNAQARPDMVSFITYFGACAKSYNSEFAQKAEDLVLGLYNIYEKGDHSLKPDMHSVNSVILAWVRCRQPHRAQQLLHRIEEDYRRASLMKLPGSAVIAPDAIAYNIVMDGWVKSGRKDAAAKTEEVFECMQKMYEQGNAQARPNLSNYRTCIMAFAKANDAQFAQKAEDVFFRVYNTYRQGDYSLKPDTQMLNLVMLAWVWCGQPHRAQQLLNHIEKEYRQESHTTPSGTAVMAPDAITYSIVMDGWVKSGSKDAAAKTEEVFDWMQKMYKQGNAQARPKLANYRTYIEACAKANDAQFAQKAEDAFFRVFDEHQKGGLSLRADEPIVNTVMLAWVRCGQPQRAQQLLERMEEEYRRDSLTKSSFNAVMAPSYLWYNTVMNGWVKSGRKDAAKKTEEVFNRMLQMHQQGNAQARPDIVSYRMLIGACADTRDAQFVQKAEDAFFRVYNEHQKGGLSLRPNDPIVNTVMLAWVRCGQPQRAQQLLERMEEEYIRDSLTKPSGTAALAPVCLWYNTVMGGWAQSGSEDAAKKTEEVFNRMQQMHQQGNEQARPSALSYSTLFQAYADARDAQFAQKAEDELFRVYNEYQKGGHSLKPNTQMLNLVTMAWRQCGQPQRTQQLLERIKEITPAVDEPQG